MDINFTLVVQACNFFVAYSLLRRFFFRPTIVIIEQEEMEKKVIREMISQQKNDLELQKEARRRQWHECRLYFVEQRPEGVAEQQGVFKNISPHVPQYKAEEGIIRQHIAEVKKTLEEKIQHVW